MYKFHVCLTEAEEAAYEAAPMMDKYKFSNEDEVGSLDSGSNALESAPKLVVATPEKKKHKLTSQAGPSMAQQKKATRNVEEAKQEDAFWMCMDSIVRMTDGLHRAQEGYDWMKTVIAEACQAAGGVRPEDLTKFIEENLHPRKV